MQYNARGMFETVQANNAPLKVKPGALRAPACVLLPTDARTHARTHARILKPIRARSARARAPTALARVC